MISSDEHYILIEKKKSDIWLSMRKVDHNLSTTFGDKKNTQVFVTSILSNGFRQKKLSYRPQYFCYYLRHRQVE